MTKTIETLVSDIYDLFDPKKEHTPNEENLDALAEGIKQILRVRFQERQENSPTLRFSSLGKKDRQLWYQAKGYPTEDMHPKTFVKFLYGDLLEALMIFLAKEAGHEVTDEQKEVEVDGVKGHIDCKIDGVVVDVKSASSFSFQKFKSFKILEDDPFGYIAQLSGYANVETPGKPAAFLVFDKVHADIELTTIGSTITNEHKPEERIEHLKEVLASDEPPPRCYEDEPDGKSGNRKLRTGCSYCSYKAECWPGLRTFLYSGGPRFLTCVSKLPEVYEVRKEGDD